MSDQDTLPKLRWDIDEWEEDEAFQDLLFNHWCDVSIRLDLLTAHLEKTWREYKEAVQDFMHLEVEEHDLAMRRGKAFDEEAHFEKMRIAASRIGGLQQTLDTLVGEGTKA